MERLAHWNQFISHWLRMNEATHEFAHELQVKHGLTGKQFGLLRVVSWVAPASLTDLKPFIPGYDSSISQIVDRLVKKGYLRRAVDARDRRKIVLSLEAKGRKVLDTVPLVGPQRVMKLLQEGGEAQARELAQAMELVATALFGPADAKRKSAPLAERDYHIKLKKAK